MTHDNPMFCQQIEETNTFIHLCSTTCLQCSENDAEYTNILKLILHNRIAVKFPVYSTVFLMTDIVLAGCKP